MDKNSSFEPIISVENLRRAYRNIDSVANMKILIQCDTMTFCTRKMIHITVKSVIFANG